MILETFIKKPVREKINQGRCMCKERRDDGNSPTGRRSKIVVAYSSFLSIVIERLVGQKGLMRPHESFLAHIHRTIKKFIPTCGAQNIIH